MIEISFKKNQGKVCEKLVMLDKSNKSISFITRTKEELFLKAFDRFYIKTNNLKNMLGR